MRYGVQLGFASKAKAEEELAKMEELDNNVIITPRTYRRALRDIITLHEEVEHERTEKDFHRVAAGQLRRQRDTARRGW